MANPTCPLQLVLATILPLVGPEFEFYKTPLWDEGFERLLWPIPNVCDASAIALFHNKGLAPFETADPAEKLAAALDDLPSVAANVQVSRSVQQAGFYIIVTRERPANVVVPLRPGT